MGVSLEHLVLSPQVTLAPGMGRKPSWLKMKMPAGEDYAKLLNLVNEQRLHTVCQSAKCPNMGECWAAGTATLMILGDVCTRSCGFCHIATGRPPTLDLDEPRARRRRGGDDEPQATSSSPASIATSCPTAAPASGPRRSGRSACNPPAPASKCSSPISAATGTRFNRCSTRSPDILNHNIETVPRLYQHVRPQAKYHRIAQAAPDRQGAGLRHQDRHDAGPGRRGARDRRGARRPGRDRLRHPDARPIPPADREASAGRALGASRRIRRVESCAAKPKGCATSNPARWCAAAITRKNR